MVNTLAILMLSNDKIMFNGMVDSRLIYISINNDENIEGRIKTWVKSCIDNADVNILISDETLWRNGERIKPILVELTNGKSNIKEELKTKLSWGEASRISELSFFDRDVLKNLVISAIEKGYNSNNIKVIEDKIATIFNDKCYFDVYRRKVHNEKIDEGFSKNKKLLLISLSLIAGVLFSFFFFNYAGVSHIIFTSYILVAFFVFNKTRNSTPLAYFFLVSGVLLSVTFLIFSNPVLRLLNMFLVPLSLATSLLLFTYEDIPLTFFAFCKSAYRVTVLESFLNSVKLPSFFKDIFRKESKEGKSQVCRSIMIGLAISIPIVFVLMVILSGADSMFRYSLEHVADILVIDNFYELIRDVFATIIVTFFMFGLYLSFGYKNSFEGDVKHQEKNLDSIIVITLLVVISMLYIVFTKVQITYLYGTKELPLGMTYSQYARNGFFQLVVIVVINVISVIVLKIKTLVKNQGIDKILNCIYSLITVLTFNMAFSALYKLRLYIDALGYTRLRIMVEVFIIFLHVVLLLLIIFIWREINLFKPILLVGTVMYIAMNFFNIDRFIAAKNLQLLSEGVKLDKTYISYLSADAYAPIKSGADEDIFDQNFYNNWVINNRASNIRWYEYNYYRNKVSKVK